jgi:hypothetical protein
MALVVPLQGELQLLNKLLQAALAVDENYILKLYQNNVAPDASFVPGSLTEANFTGYAAKTLTRAGWNNAVLVGSVAQSSYSTAAQSWTCGSVGNTAYGYWVEGATSGVLLWAEQFSVARVLANGDRRVRKVA